MDVEEEKERSTTGTCRCRSVHRHVDGLMIDSGSASIRNIRYRCLAFCANLVVQ